MKPQLSSPQSAPKAFSENEIVRLAWLAVFVSVFSFLFYSRHGDLPLYGDAVAHTNIARRIFDSKTPGLLQLGTVWLPLPHLLIAPFIVSKQMWQSGMGASIPSMAGFVLGVLGVFRLVRTAVPVGGEVDEATKICAWATAMTFAANPNLIYMQSTAMGESLYLACFVWSVAYFAEFARYRYSGATQPSQLQANRFLMKCGLCLLAACLTRYDGWFLAVILVVAVAVIAIRDYSSPAIKPAQSSSPPVRSAMVKFLFLAALGPALWLAYNAAVYRNPLEFANGPYSAKAIEQNTATVNPAKGNVVAAGAYFLKAAELNVGASPWQGRLWLALALLGSLVAAFSGRLRAALLLWAPLPFYALSVAYGSVPIFLPSWWPFSIYNARYGLQLLPAFAVFVPLAIAFLLKCAAGMPGLTPAWARRAPVVAALGWLVLLLITYGAIWRADPICYSEAQINSRGRFALDTQLANWVKSFPPNATLLMYLGQHPGALQLAGFPFRNVINEGNHRMWRQPSDPEGLWERALADPGANANFIIGFDGDPVWKTARDHGLTALVEIHTTGQARAAIFQGHMQNENSSQPAAPARP
jgi:hypothetical protein